MYGDDACSKRFAFHIATFDRAGWWPTGSGTPKTIRTRRPCRTTSRPGITRPRSRRAGISSGSKVHRRRRPHRPRFPAADQACPGRAVRGRHLGKSGLRVSWHRVRRRRAGSRDRWPAQRPVQAGRRGSALTRRSTLARGRPGSNVSRRPHHTTGCVRCGVAGEPGVRARVMLAARTIGIGSSIRASTGDLQFRLIGPCLPWFNLPARRWCSPGSAIVVSIRRGGHPSTPNSALSAGLRPTSTRRARRSQ